MSWTCNKHEWDEGSPSWAEYLMTKDHATGITQGRQVGEGICPKCANELGAENDRLREVVTAVGLLQYDTLLEMLADYRSEVLSGYTENREADKMIESIENLRELCLKQDTLKGE
jgi:hypothetical protein